MVLLWQMICKMCLLISYLLSIQGNDFKKYDEGQKVTFDIKMTSRGRYDSNVHKR